MDISVKQALIKKLESKAYRDAYVAGNISNGISSQIRAMRERSGWTQEELGRRVGMAQESISQLEDPNYGRITLRTLKRLASAFDVAVLVRFAPFSDLVDWVTSLKREDLAVPNYDSDIDLEGPFLEALPITGTGGFFSAVGESVNAGKTDVDHVSRTRDNVELDYDSYTVQPFYEETEFVYVGR